MISLLYALQILLEHELHVLLACRAYTSLLVTASNGRSSSFSGFPKCPLPRVKPSTDSGHYLVHLKTFKHGLVTSIYLNSPSIVPCVTSATVTQYRPLFTETIFSNYSFVAVYCMVVAYQRVCHYCPKIIRMISVFTWFLL